MEIEYTVTREDLIELARHVRGGSRAVTKDVRVQQWVPALLAGGAAAYFWIRLDPDWAGGKIYIGFFAAFAVVWLVGYPAFARWYAATLAKKIAAEGRVPAPTGRHRLRITDEALIHTTDTIEVTAKWEGVHKVERAEGYVFVFIGFGDVVVVPEERVLSGDYPAFIDALESHIAGGNS